MKSKGKCPYVKLCKYEKQGKCYNPSIMGFCPPEIAQKSNHVYLLHFSSNLSHARHYCGWTPGPVSDRLHLHETGRGAHICRAAIAHGIKLECVRIWDFETWQEAREYERKLKRTHNLGRYCPLCKFK